MGGVGKDPRPIGAERALTGEKRAGGAKSAARGSRCIRWLAGCKTRKRGWNERRDVDERATSFECRVRGAAERNAESDKQRTKRVRAGEGIERMLWTFSESERNEHPREKKLSQRGRKRVGYRRLMSGTPRASLRKENTPDGTRRKTNSRRKEKRRVSLLAKTPP